MRKLPWSDDHPPLMLAPMQGLTNDALRRYFIEQVEPDLVFTEFVRVQQQSRKRVAKAELAEIRAHDSHVPLVVQLIGHNAEALGEAAVRVQEAGCQHLNLNLGCPYGRMTTGATGGELLREPARLAELLTSLRQACSGSFSVKCRSGYDDPQQIFDLLPLYEECGIDYLILHPRTVLQKYSGQADHQLTAEVVQSTKLPVIANGDINDAQTGRALLRETGVAGLMLGRGALADPLLFCRIRGEEPEQLDQDQRRAELGKYIGDLLEPYLVKFCGERQALMKLKDLLNFIPDECLQRELGKLKRANTAERFRQLLAKYFSVV
ncbi:tRNA-U20a,U20b-dihydrouridine synthase [Malonomonas rubra DSM 5091]|uniref:tRNA-dihydrouridine synthase n=1 Tax=Malonomonas rubra DSM 5091 TaxID=1122189 RepID=A0A1M6GMY8_MALRU|nr:tRNA-dihydrouridine synthase family protein [Malonomonas rubra]SHJ11324.1 tRNA-U20a,U20b-dihydrouridine synthase [Malonomonas rubra DSM 5091]